MSHFVPPTYRYTSLLTPPGYNPKADKGRARNYESTVMYLAPATLSGREVCGDRSIGCTDSCLFAAGRGGFDPEVSAARLQRTNALFEQRAGFFLDLVAEIESFVRRASAKGRTPCVRLNGTSDLPWERMPFVATDGTRYSSILEYFPTVQFYDYTKNAGRAISNAMGIHPANYHLTFSRSESNERKCLDVLAAGGNVAVVFSTATKHGKKAAAELPAEWNGYRVIDADTDDLRFLDPRGGVVAGLRAKGPAKKDTSGFVVQVSARAA